MRKADIFWQTYLNLEKEAIELSKYIFFTDEVLVNGKNGLVTQSCNTQLGTFSPYIADLLVRCCVQIEAISKELYFDNGGTKARGSNDIFFDEDCLKLIDIKWRTHNKIVLIVAPFFNFTKEENHILKPLKEAHKRQGTYWEKAYQAVKHDRYSSLDKGNVKAFLHALAALYLLNIYYRNDSWITSYQDLSKHDYSMGSSIFAIKAPAVEQLWYGNNPVDSDSPYIVRYKENEYQKIETMQQEEKKAIEDYLLSQKEFYDEDFILQIEEVKRTNPEKRIIYLWELEKYKLNKKIPSTLPFEDRKKLLICSKEWKGSIHQNNKRISEDELTEDNIQGEIDSAGTHWGIEISKRLQKFEWLPIAFNKDICEVYIP